MKPHICIVLGIFIIGCNGTEKQPDRCIVYLANESDAEILDAVSKHLFTPWGTIRFVTPQEPESISNDLRGVISRHLDVASSEVESDCAPLMARSSDANQDAETTVSTWTPNYYESTKASILVKMDNQKGDGGLSVLLLSKRKGVWTVIEELPISTH